MAGYQQTYSIHLDKILWDEKLWKKYLKRLKKEYRYFKSDEIGHLQLWSDNQYITEYQMQVLTGSVLSETLDHVRPLCVHVSGENTEMILPIDDKPESSTYLFYSTRLAILQTNDRAREWLLQYLMDLRLFYHKNYSNFLFLEEEIEQILDIQARSYADVEHGGGILDYIRTHIVAGEYINVHLDEFYLIHKDYYQTKHFVHENLIYGFDDTRQELYAYGIAKRQQTEKFTISYLEFLTAYEKGKLFYFCGADYLDQEGYAPVLLCKFDEIPEYQFSFHDMQAKLKAYMHPKPDEKVGEDHHVYGRNVYTWIMRELTGETDYGIVDFRVFHLLYEQKMCILRRMQCLQKRNLLPKAYDAVIKDYQNVVEIFQSIRFIYLKQLRVEGKLDSQDKRIADENTRRRLVETLEDAITKEEQILPF